MNNNKNDERVEMTRNATATAAASFLSRRRTRTRSLCIRFFLFVVLLTITNHMLNAYLVLVHNSGTAAFFASSFSASIGGNNVAALRPAALGGDTKNRTNNETILQQQQYEEEGNYPNNIANSSSSSSQAKKEFQGGVEGLGGGVDIQPRAYEPWPIINDDVELPCYDPDPDMLVRPIMKNHLSPTTKGFLFVKTVKTGSSTAASVNIRIARNVMMRRRRQRQPNATLPTTLCRARFHHQIASSMCPNRDPEQSFLWTVLREPSQRIVSQFFFFKVSSSMKNNTTQPTSLDDKFRKYLDRRTSKSVQDHYLSYLSLRPYDSPQSQPQNGNHQNQIQIINNILQEYNFMAILERFDESIVVLSMLLHLPLSDVLFLSSKLPGTYDAHKACHKLINSQSNTTLLSKSMKDTLQSKTWKDKSRWDKLLYEAANTSLDLTIEKLGKSQVAEKLVQFRKAQLIAKQRCLDKTVFPCSSSGSDGSTTTTYQSNNDCYWRDSGCGMECLDTVQVV